MIFFFIAGQPKKKKSKKAVFTVHYNCDGIFTTYPLQYSEGRVKILIGTNFDEMSYDLLLEIARKLCLNGIIEKLYYCQRGVKISSGIREIKSTEDIDEMLKTGYESGSVIDLYAQHFGYDINELAQLELVVEQAQLEVSEDEYYGSEDYEEISNVDFETEGDDCVVIKKVSTHDPFFSKLCSSRIMFSGQVKHHNMEPPLADPEDIRIDYVNKVQNGVHYPSFDPNIPWDKMEPTLGMRYESPLQLKLALANYSVAHGYQLWFLKNDWRELLVYCGRDVTEGRCAGKREINIKNT